MSESNNRPNPNHSEDEIDLIALAKTLWDGRKTIIKIVIIFILFGLFVAIFSPKEYTATTTMVPQINNTSSKLGGLSSLASLAGFNLDMSAGGNDISPVLYPQIINSTLFQLSIMNTKYSFEELDEDITLFDYYMNYYKPGLFERVEKYTLGLPDLIFHAIRSGQERVNNQNHPNYGIIRITLDQQRICKILNKKLNLSLNDKDGYLTLESKFHQAELSASIAKRALNLLQENIIRLKIEKASDQLVFIEGRYEEAKSDFEKTQTLLAKFKDSHKNISSASSQFEQQNLENNYQLSYEVFLQLSKQLEQAKIQVKEDTPVFSIIEEVVVPIEKSKPKRIMIILFFLFAGIFFGMAFIYGKIAYKNFRYRWKILK
jgi:uncharacterized protein involved in exopolysaccharide biosynthesis